MCGTMDPILGEPVLEDGWGDRNLDFILNNHIERANMSLLG
jgi:hypothetical protein